MAAGGRGADPVRRRGRRLRRGKDQGRLRSAAEVRDDVIRRSLRVEPAVRRLSR